LTNAQSTPSGERSSTRRACCARLRAFQDYQPGDEHLPLPEYENGNELRIYQIDRLNWLRFHYHTHVNSILADEVGLGKMVMCIAMLDDVIKRRGVPEPFLIMAPLGHLFRVEPGLLGILQQRAVRFIVPSDDPQKISNSINIQSPRN
jgi:hypothetical protein